MIDRLSPAQHDALDALADLEPRATLTGGAALSCVHLGHRTTRDLDLFFHDVAALGRIPEEAAHRLRVSGFDATIQERFATFGRVLAQRGGETVIVDLVADPVPTVEPPTPHRIGRSTVLVDTPREILANKLCALLGRSEVRDLVDVDALLATGRDLGAALVDAASKDAGFSPLQLAWTLRSFPLGKLARVEGMDDASIARLDGFRLALIAHLVADTKPDA